MLETLPPLLPAILALIISGALAGVLAGLLGIGGGIVLVPALFYIFTALGYDSPELIQICIATSMATIVVTSLRSLQAHHAKGAVIWPILRAWAAGLLLGAVLGVFFAAGLDAPVLQFIFAVLGGLIGAYMILGRTDWVIGNQMPGRWFTAAFSPVVGFLSVFLGIGGGSFGVPMMTLHRVPIHNAIATAAGFGPIIAVPASLAWLWVGVSGNTPPLTFGAVNIMAFAIIISMTSLCAPIGASLAHRLNPKPLRRIFGVFLLIVAADMLRLAVFA